MSIISLLNQIQNTDIVLPAIQRNFVWDEEQITTLMDSIMRGYPIGIVLLWETYNDVQYRKFEEDFDSDDQYKYHENSKRQRIRVVLDGQQRLQSLYVALYGTYAGKSLFFDVLSGRESDDFRVQKFIFRFATQKVANAWNDNGVVKIGKESVACHYVNVKELFAMSGQQRQKFRKSLSTRLGLEEADELRLETNLARFDDVLAKDDNILKTSVIDENRPPDNPERKSEADVLEIFVRINVQGTQLSRSDLIFSMLKLNWKESAEALPEFVAKIQEGNSLDLNTDFVIRCLLAVSDLGTRFDLEPLRKKSNVEKLQKRYDTCCDAISSAVDFVVRDCGCQSTRALGGIATLIPLVYYLFHAPKHQVPKNQTEAVRKSLFLFAFTQPFSRYADSRLGNFIREELKPRLEKGDHAFPLRSAVAWIQHWEQVAGFGSELIQRNPILACNLVQNYSGGKNHFKSNAPEVDHIFPRSVLKKRGFEPTDIEHFANYWILSKGKNQNKSYTPPAKYFADVSDAELERALIPRNLLSYDEYIKFLAVRAKAIIDTVKARTGLSSADFAKEAHSTP